MDEKLYKYMDWPRIEAVVYGEEVSPKDVMGPRITKDGVLIQGFFPEAKSAKVIAGKKEYQMEMEDEAGYFAVLLPAKRIPKYSFLVQWEDYENQWTDPYQYSGQMLPEEEKAFCAGVYYESYKKLGAHLMTVDGVEGTYFAVWAPNAQRVSVVGDFNNWDGRFLMMHRMPMSGIFELFVPDIKAGTLYKYEIKEKSGKISLKADPYGFGAEKPKDCASVVTDLSGFSWDDGEWMEARKKYDDRKQPISIYETDITKWESGEELAEFMKETGYTHVEFKPVMEYLEESTGGYSTSSYYAPTSRFGTPEKFQKAVNLLHQAEVGVILDWTPAQFPRFEGGLEKFDGTPLYEIPDESASVHPMWGTMLYNYGSPMVRDFLIANACFWTEVYHVDGFRMDDVDAMLYLDYGRNMGEWQPNLYGTNENLYAVEFLKHLNSIVKKRNPGVLLIAQEDGLWPELTDSVENDHLGFDYKWSGGWTRDFLEYLASEPENRKRSHDQLTLSTLYAYSEHYILTLGSRDVGTLDDFRKRIWGDENQKEAEIRAAYGYMTLHPGCKMSAPDKEMPKALKEYIRDLNTLYKEQPALWKKDDDYEGLEWIQLMKYEENVLTFLRKTENPSETLLAVCNFAADTYENYQVGVPYAGKYKEIFNSDLKKYGGNGVGNPRVKTAKSQEWDERPYSIKMKIPALGILVFSVTPQEEMKKASGRKVSEKRVSEKCACIESTAEKKTRRTKK
ncbi:MAG: 1,4-alpha-glucan branching enzyme [Clostridiales bacterium]|nr:1,4-alpha-glucan branching enzyme [Clostridiales bacterium]